MLLCRKASCVDAPRLWEQLPSFLTVQWYSEGPASQVLQGMPDGHAPQSSTLTGGVGEPTLLMLDGNNRSLSGVEGLKKRFWFCWQYCCTWSWTRRHCNNTYCYIFIWAFPSNHMLGTIEWFPSDNTRGHKTCSAPAPWHSDNESSSIFQFLLPCQLISEKGKGAGALGCVDSNSIPGWMFTKGPVAIFSHHVMLQ